MVGHGSHNKPAGTWSDDTSMALAICDSYRELGRIDVDDVRGRFVRWCREGAYTVDGLFDISNVGARASSRRACSEDGQFWIRHASHNASTASHNALKMTRESFSIGANVSICSNCFSESSFSMMIEMNASLSERPQHTLC